MIWRMLLWRGLRGGIIGTVLLLCGVLIFEFIVPSVAEDVGTNQLDPVLASLPPAIQALTRSNPDLLIGAGMQGYLTIGFSSPVYLVLIISGMLAYSTSLAGELERGSVQLALSRPISRVTVYAVRVVGVLLLAALFGAAGPLGIEVGLRFSQPSEHVNHLALVPTALAAFAFLWAIGGVSLGLAAAGSRHGQVVGQAIAWLIVSYFINYFATMWDVLRPLTPYSVFNYFDPTRTMIDGVWMPRDLVVLGITGLVGATVGAVIFRRRDLPV